MFMLHILEESNLGFRTSYPEVSHVFPQALQANARIEPQTGPQLLLSTFLLIQ
jgi:hypothetical protein